MKTRLFKNYVTSIIGMLLLIGSAYAFWMSKITFTEFSGFLSTCFLLFRAKDSLLWAKPKEEE